MNWTGRIRTAALGRLRRSWRELAAALVATTILLVVPQAFAVFNSTTPNTGNTFNGGNVVVADNDGGSSTLFSLTNVKPSDTSSSCVKINYAGNLPATVNAFGTLTGTGLGAYVTLTVTRGAISSGAFGDCTNFVADSTNYGQGAGVVYNGNLSAFPTTNAAGVVDPDTSTVPEVWTSGEVHAYRFTTVVQDDNLAQGKTVTAAFTWQGNPTTAYSQLVLSDNPASYWKMDEAAGTAATDSVGAISGTHVNGPVLNRPTGVEDANTAIYYDGVNDYTTFGDQYDYAGNAAYSVEMWVNRTTLGEATVYRCLVDKMDYNAPRNGWGLRIIPDNGSSPQAVSFERWVNGLSYNATGSTPLQAGKWYHVAATYTGTVASIYINGVLDQSTSTGSTLPGNTAQLRLAVTSNGGGRSEATMDEVAIYSYALSAQQILDHFNAGRT